MPRLRTSPITLLKAAKKQIATEETWCRYHSAVTASGRAVSSTDPNAAKRCAEGAFWSVAGNWTPAAQVAVWRALLDAAERLFAMSPTLVNDQIGFAAVHKMYDEAIRIATQEKQDMSDIKPALARNPDPGPDASWLDADRLAACVRELAEAAQRLLSHNADFGHVIYWGFHASGCPGCTLAAALAKYGLAEGSEG